MTKSFKLSLLFISSLFSNSILFAQEKDLVKYVNPLMGTFSKPDLSNGNTYPAISTPWGMNMWTPQTGKNGDGWQYRYSEEKIRGFKQTHQPSPWMNDYGVFSLMPISGKLKFKEEERQSWFSHKSEISKPDYYSVYLADYNITTEITPTERAAIFKFTFGTKADSYVVLDAFNKGSHVKIIPSENKIIGYNKYYRRGKLENFANYFVITFDTPFSEMKTWQKEELLGQLETTGEHSGAVVGFNITKKNQIVTAKVASSFISLEQAELNLKREVGNKTFTEVQKETHQLWNDILGKALVEGGTDEQTRTFYSCLYRTALFPNKLYEKDATGKIVHYSPYNGKIENGYMFGGTGFWDTFRALYPLINLLNPKISSEMQQGLANDYREGGFLPEWSSPGFSDIMIGNNSASVVADAFIKKIPDQDTEILWNALENGANKEGPMSAVGRFGVDYYNKIGYVPYDVNINENAARTLEYAYDDFSIYQFIKDKNINKSIKLKYAQRALNYKNVFDKSTNLMRGRNFDGTFQSPFNPLKWGDAFTEGNAWHYTWSVFHDINGLQNLMGGKKVFAKMLDSVFSMAPDFDDSYYGGTIHEIREMQIANMGQYAHGNQPIQHMIYLYNYAEQSYKAQYWLRETMNRMYQPTPDGYCGDEDNGQTSAWYVFSAMGFYPVCPATPEYVIGAPLFKKITLTFENGKKFVINAPKNSAENKYISSQKFNGKNYSKTFLNHFEMLKGGTLDFEMGVKPNENRKYSDSDLPYSFSKNEPIYKELNQKTTTSDRSMFKNQIINETKGDLSLMLIDNHSVFTNAYKQRFVDMYFLQYPKLIHKYNKNSLKKVTFVIDKNYKGVAETDNGIITFNPEWFAKNP
ncbi:GH92 family glycosyl hydrolase [Halpernia frigidisoli]|uniref:Alpha-1,2-mannosidase, putative n=1 Tax=Halpernia frigidisoli TaxID=1125876 RepID=A0A1I3D5S9_9FLAO|nr:GH92 family glycosyl hydrolase [Halpernia frigidisoli]SFH82055.1 alpha-1,2-mannosidase, putative [Halpernia frigidisoli]